MGLPFSTHFWMVARLLCKIGKQLLYLETCRRLYSELQKPGTYIFWLITFTCHECGHFRIKTQGSSLVMIHPARAQKVYLTTIYAHT